MQWDDIRSLKVYDAIQLFLLRTLVVELIEFVLVNHGRDSLDEITVPHGFKALTDQHEVEVIGWTQVTE